MILAIPPAGTDGLHSTDVSIWAIILTIFLVFLNGFFVAAEFAIVKVRSSQVDSAKTSPELKKVAKSITNSLDNYLAATQLGITLASLGLGWVGESVTVGLLTKVFDRINFSSAYITPKNLALPIGFLIITILHIVFGELAPKSIAIRKPLQTTLLIALPLRAFNFICKPFIYLLNGMANLLLRLVGIPPIGEHEIHSEEEIKLIVSESEEGGAIEDSERELINNVFDFDTRRVKDILTHRKDIVAFDVETPFVELVEKTIEEGYSRYPIYEESLSELIGILNIKDLLKYYKDKKEIDIREIVRPIFYIPESMKIKDLLKDFQKDHVQIAIVVNEFGDIAGIVTMEDVLEELVGDIQDEHDSEQPIVETEPDGSLLVMAHEPIADINEFLPEPLEEGNNYTTLSGLITYEHGSVPTEGETLVLQGYEMRIVTMYRSSVEKVLLRPLDTLGNESS